MKFDITQILERYGTTVPHRTYGYVKVKCPAHDETRPSASVRDNQLHCFGCGWSGDAIDLIKELDGVNYADAVQRAEEITGTSMQPIPGQREGCEWFPSKQ